MQFLQNCEIVRWRWIGGSQRKVLFGFLCILLIQNVLCDDALKEQVRESTAKDKLLKLSKTKNDKPVIVIAETVVKTVEERVESPQNWNSWTPVPTNSTNWVQTPQTTPLSLEEQLKRQQYHKWQQERRENYEKLAKKPSNKGKVSIEDMKTKVMHFGKMLMSSLGGTGTNFGPLGEMAKLASLVTSTYSNGDASSRHAENNSDNQEESRSGALGWLSRLIGIQGKTLGEFLREYQVHVLYDLVFIFFKWIFFVYAGLLVP